MKGSREGGSAGRSRTRARPSGGDEGRRPGRVAAEIQRILSDLLVRRSKDPRLVQVTVTRVDLTPDLRHARVAYTLLGGDDQRDEIQRALVHATPFLKRGVGAALGLRYVPDLAFGYDVALEGARRIDDLLRGLKRPDDEEAEAAAHEPSAASTEVEAANEAADEAADDGEDGA